VLQQPVNVSVSVTKSCCCWYDSVYHRRGMILNCCTYHSSPSTFSIGFHSTLRLQLTLATCRETPRVTTKLLNRWRSVHYCC